MYRPEYNIYREMFSNISGADSLMMSAVGPEPSAMQLLARRGDTLPDIRPVEWDTGTWNRTEFE